MTPEEKETRRAYVNEYRKRPGVMEAKRASYHKNKEKHKEKIREYNRKRYQEQPERFREVNHGMVFATGQTIASMYAEQDGKCAICQRPLPKGKNTHVDHDHSITDGSPNVRALLCHSDNLMIGRAHEDAARLRAGADYLEKMHQKLRAAQDPPEPEKVV